MRYLLSFNDGSDYHGQLVHLSKVLFPRSKRTPQIRMKSLPQSRGYVRLTGITISRISDGRTAEDWTSYDALGMMRQLGLIPEPGQS